MTAFRSGHRLGLTAVAFTMALAWAPSHVRAQERDNPAARDSAFLYPRAFPFHRVPPGALQAARRAMLARWPRTSAAVPAPAPSSYVSSQSWSPLGPAPISSNSSIDIYSGSFDITGRINTIALEPGNPQVVYIGAATGGVWKTTDGGASWTPLTDDQCGLAMGSLAIDPVDPQIVYAGTGEANFSADSYQGCGVLVSTDGGSTWTQSGASTFVTPNGAAQISKVLVDPETAGSTTSTVVLVASVWGLYRSANSGASWTQVLSQPVSDLVASPNPGVYYAATGDFSGSGGVYKSTDDGLTWTPLSAFPGAGAGVVRLGISATAPTVLYASAESVGSQQLLGMWRSTDGGATWTSLAASGASCATQCWYDMYLAVDPSDPATVYFGGLDLYKSTDSAQAFTDLGSSLHVDQHALVFEPGFPDTILVGNDGGIYRSGDGGTTWTSLNTDLSITQFYAGVSYNPANASDILGGVQDNGVPEWGGVPTWTAESGGDGGYSVFSPGGTTAYYALGGRGDGYPGVFRRAGGGAWQYLATGITTSDRMNWVPPLVMDPTNPNVLYYGTYRLYRSTDGGSDWTAITGDLTNGSGGLSTVAVAPSDPNTIYTASEDGAANVTTDGGLTWRSISGGLPNRSITRIAVDPLDPHTAWLTVSGYGTGHVWKTTNGGSSWTDISYDLPNAPVNAIVLQLGSRELDVGTDVGVFALPQGATSWTPLAAGLPTVPVTDLVYDGPHGRLIAGTHGRGVFALATSSAVLRGNITNTGTLSALDAQVILAAVVGLPLPSGAIRYPNGDANCDGNVTAVDALLVLSKLVGLNTSGTCVGTVR